MHYISNSLFFILGITLLISCKAEDEHLTCNPVNKITTQEGFYDPSLGLTLVASGYKVIAGPTQFTWSLFPQEDVNEANISSSYRKQLIGNETIIIPDELLFNVPKFVAKVDISGCEGQKMESKYYSFVRKESATASCEVWVEQQ